MNYKGGRGVVPPGHCQCHAGVVRYETDYGILLMSVCQNSPQRGEVVRKVKHSSVRIENPLLALYRGLGFSLEMSANLGSGEGRTLCPAVPYFCFPSGRRHIDLCNSLIYSELLNSVWISVRKIIGNPRLK